MTLDLRVYRERPTAKKVAKVHAQALWAYLQSQTSVKGKASSRGGDSPARP
jgi:hypothetical protein